MHPPASLLHRVAAGLLGASLLVGSVAVAAPALAQDDDADLTPGAAALATPVLSARRTPWLVQGAVADSALADAISGTLDRDPDTWCALVEDRGRPVLTVNPDTPVSPASTLKLVTGTAFLEAFGSDHTLRTVLAAVAAPEDGVVRGDLFLVGGGDPLLATSGYAASYDDPDTPWLDAGVLADALVQAGVREVTGGIVGDDSRYDAQRWVSTWPTRYQADPSVGPISALNVNDGFTGYTATPERPNSSRRAGEPAALAAETLRTLLQQRGVVVRGGASAGTAPEGSVEVAAVDSRPMRELVGQMVLASDNNTAEMLLKELGLARRGQGSTEAGLAALREVLTGLGVPLEGADLRDASGLDPENKLTCRTVATVLDRHGRGSELTANLAVAGERGTLRRRLQGSPATGRVTAKTGTLNSVNALAGWADTPAGATLGFTAIGNASFGGGTGAADAFAEALMSYPEGPSADELGPRPLLADSSTDAAEAAAP